jgi:hypothetical protein
MEQIAGVFGVTALMLSVGAGITKATDFIRNLFDSGNEAPKWVWNVTPFGLGIGSAFLLDVGRITIPPGFLAFDLSGIPLQIVTGLALGGIASGWHEKFDSWSRAAKP